MNTIAAPSLAQPADTTVWRPLGIQNLYRLLIAGLATALCIGNVVLPPLGEYDMALFRITAYLYLAAGIAAHIATRLRRPRFTIQIYSQIILDIIAITLLMHASGGVQSGIGVLLIVVIANSSLLMTGRMSMLFAAVATLAVLFAQAQIILTYDQPAISYVQAGLLGAGLFATATLGYILARRILESEALAEQRGIDLANMAQLTFYIIQRMQTGIIVIDEKGSIRLLNESARHLLDLQDKTSAPASGLHALNPDLEQELQYWQRDHITQASSFRNKSNGAEIQPRFASLGTRGQSGTLIFLEDKGILAQQAQQMKLVSLGRLTASIAHEIRNPLSAINHASQLLSESSRLDPQDIHLNGIIQNHVTRINAIIENIMQLSRRDKSRLETLSLLSWLEKFAAEFCDTNAIPRRQLVTQVAPVDLMIRFDPSQLHQVVWNLCENGWRHSQGARHPTLHLTAGIGNNSYSPYISICDNGPGIPDEIALDIFEPFFTTERNGTGLGLYIARELCESNRAQLGYQPATGGGACFIITLSDPRRHTLAIT
ncbi:MAG: ATPase [Gammaproteobacteria bacterium]|nr:ATPase [Gammaproteobacteria bacterium]